MKEVPHRNGGRLDNDGFDHLVQAADNRGEGLDSVRISIKHYQISSVQVYLGPDVDTAEISSEGACYLDDLRD